MSSKDEREKLKQQTHEVRWLYKAGWLADWLVRWNNSLMAGWLTGWLDGMIP